MSEPQLVTDPNWGGAPPAARAATVPVDAPRDVRGQIITSAEEHEPTLLEQMAHPQTLVDFARLLTLPVDSVRKALATAVASRIAPTVAGHGLSAAGRGIESLAESRAAKFAEKAGVADAVFRMDPKGVAVAMAPPALRLVGRGLQAAGGALSGESNVISVADEAALLKQGYSPQVIAKMRTATPPTPPPPAAGPVAAAPVEPVPPTPPPTAAAEAAAPAAKFRLVGQEQKEYMRLIKAGKTHREAADLIQAQRDFAAKFGTPSGEQVRTSVTDRNASGRWPE